MPFDPSRTYIADRATVELWAIDDDEDAARWLRAYPDATAFGIDDDAIQAWFASDAKAAEWLNAMRADSESR